VLRDLRRRDQLHLEGQLGKLWRWAVAGTLKNCTLSGNSASGGGGAFECTLYNCTLMGNSASYGGGAYGGTLNNCTLTGNSAGSDGGGASYSTLNNCIVYFNSANNGANYSADEYGNYDCVLNYCCTTPLPVPQAWQEPFVGNISEDPQLASASHISTTSPCRGPAAPRTRRARTLTERAGAGLHPSVVMNTMLER